MNNDRRVVITGLGAITPLGNDVETFWRNLKNGVSGIHKIEAFDTAAYDCKIGGEVRGFDPKALSLAAARPVAPIQPHPIPHFYVRHV